MKLEQAEALIKLVANTVNPDGHYLFGREYDATIDYGKPWPQIHLYPLKQNKRGNNDNIVYTECLIGFWSQDGHDKNKDQRAGLIFSMDDLANSFEATLRAQKIEVQTFSKESMYLKMMAVATGVAIRVVFSSAIGCEPVTLICAPATVTFQSEFLTNINSGAGKNIELVNQDDVPVVVISAVNEPLQSTITIGTRVIVKRSDNTVIAEKSGPGEYPVADSIAVLKDTDGGELSQIPIKAASNGDVTAPNSIVKLNGEAFLTPKSGQTVDVLLRGKDGAVMIPETVAGAQINFDYDYFFKLANCQ